MCNGRHLTRATRREEKCPARTIPVEQLDELVWQDVCLVLTHPQQIAEALAQALGGHWLPQALQARRENLRKAAVERRAADGALDRCVSGQGTEPG